MLTRLLNVKWCSYILYNAHLSSGLHFIRLSGPYFSCHELSYIYSFVFQIVKSESFPIFMGLPLIEFTDYSETVFSIDIHWVFPTSLVYVIIQE